MSDFELRLIRDRALLDQSIILQELEHCFWLVCCYCTVLASDELNCFSERTVIFRVIYLCSVKTGGKMFLTQSQTALFQLQCSHKRASI